MPQPFLVRLRAYSAIHLAHEDRLWITWPDAKAVLQSEYTGGKSGRAYPVTLHGEIRGSVADLDAAQERLGGSLNHVFPIVALAGNAAIDNPLMITAHGLDLSDPAPFIWYHTPGAAHWFPPGRRTIDPELVHSLMVAVARHPETETLYQAIASYREALGHWMPEQQLMAGEFLFIAAETLSRCIIEQRAAARGMTPKNLARLLKCGSDKALRRKILEEEVFRSDTAALEAMETASNGFEHGYMAIHEARGLMVRVLERAMVHVRRALIETAGVDMTTQQALLANPYSEPRGLVPVLQILQGQLRRQDTAQPLPAMNSPAVELSWPAVPIEVEEDTGPDLTLKLPSNITVTLLPENTTLDINGTGLRASAIKGMGIPEIEGPFRSESADTDDEPDVDDS